MTQPLPTPLRARAAEIVSAARALLEECGFDDLTMRDLAEHLDIRAPSLYKHFASKSALKVALIEQGLLELGAELHTAADRPDPIRDVLLAYRRFALANPNLYRLGTVGPIPRSDLAPGLEEWAGEPFFTVTGDPSLSQALWSFAHGTAILEIDQRFWESDLDLTWAAGASAFATAVAERR